MSSLSFSRCVFPILGLPDLIVDLSVFVLQEDDHHLPALTVRETLRYAARLRLKDRPTAECDARAEEVLRMLGLKQCADNIVGGEVRLLSCPRLLLSR